MTAAQLRRVRRDLGWSQTEFATKLGYSPQTISYYERGQGDIPLWMEKQVHALAVMVDLCQVLVHLCRLWGLEEILTNQRRHRRK